MIWIQRTNALRRAHEAERTTFVITRWQRATEVCGLDLCIREGGCILLRDVANDGLDERAIGVGWTTEHCRVAGKNKAICAAGTAKVVGYAFTLFV